MKKITLLSLLFIPLFSSNVTYLNNIRESVGLNTLQENTSLKDAAQAHAKYLLNNHINSHYENATHPYFVGKTPSSRVLKFGYPTKDVKENISTNAKTDKESIDTLLSAIYHRFVFLDFHIDQVGIGIEKDNKNKDIKSAYVYDMGLSSIVKLCQEDFLTLEGELYMQNLCKDDMKYIPKITYKKAKDSIAKTNPKMILFPNVDATNVPTAFFDEKPNPMPGYKVSGYPISASLNPYYFKNIKLKKFRLYNNKGRMVRAKLFKYSNDPNKRLKPYEFAIIPLQRLDYDSDYSAYVEIITNKGKVKKRWKFHTKKFDKPLYIITKQYTNINVNKQSIILYIKPRNRKDIIKNLHFKGQISISFIDLNTIEVSDIKTDAVVYVGNKTIKIKKIN